MKDTKNLIAAMLAQGITNQAEIARQLGLERQAVSIAIKRHGLKSATR
jgi:transcriptional regulator with GAF, ATPase, and Fis domain